MEDRILSVRNLTVHYVKQETVVKAVNNLSFDLARGETLGIVGETGAGKTTTARSLMKLIPDPPGKIMGGEILFERNNVLSMSKSQLRKLRGKKISMIFQDPMTSLNPVLTIGEQVTEVIRIHQKTVSSRAVVQAQEILETVGIAGDRFNDYPHQFSGGMKQRVVIAIALACTPQLLIADEPTTALDVTIQAQVLEMMVDLKRRFNTSMILISHDLGVVAQNCDTTSIMYAGEIVESGPVGELFDLTRPHHPYTTGLFGAIPDLSKPAKRLNPVAGLMPDPTNLPGGCKFHVRCPKCMDVCRTEAPKPRADGNRAVRCHLFEGGLRA